MTVASPLKGYQIFRDYGKKKLTYSIEKLLIQGILAGFWVGLYGHCSTVAGSFFFNKENVGIAKFVYALIFPGAFIAVAYPGTELYTGNTAAMVIVLLEKKLPVLISVLKVLGLSVSGNLLGAVISAYMFSFATGVFNDVESPAAQFLFYLSGAKTSRSFYPSFMLAIGCNCLVCLASFCVAITTDGSGKILAIFYTVAAFAAGGFEHIVANFYTLSAALMCRAPDLGFGKVVVANWIPVFLGNTVAGLLFTGGLWWVCFYDRSEGLNLHRNIQSSESMNLEKQLSKDPNYLEKGSLMPESSKLNAAGKELDQ